MPHGYPPGVELRPLVMWPGPMTPIENRRPSAFSSNFSNTMKLLEKELRLYDKRDTDWPTTVLQLAISEADLRNDGLPRARAVPKHSGIILSVEPKYKPRISLPCDTFVHWHDNLRAIALTLEALRQIDRYGVAQSDEQYRGWQALPAGSNDAVSVPGGITIKAGDRVFARPEEAFAHLATLIGAPNHRGRPSPEIVTTVYKRARSKTHPDINGGDHTEYELVDACGQVLKASGWL